MNGKLNAFKSVIYHLVASYLIASTSIHTIQDIDASFLGDFISSYFIVGRHDSLFVVGSLDQTVMLRGMRYHTIDIETSVLRSFISSLFYCRSS